MKITTNLVVISTLLVFTGCAATVPITATMGMIGMTTKETLDYGLSREELAIKKGELQLKRDRFEYEKEMANGYK